MSTQQLWGGLNKEQAIKKREADKIIRAEEKAREKAKIDLYNKEQKALKEKEKEEKKLEEPEIPKEVEEVQEVVEETPVEESKEVDTKGMSLKKLRSLVKDKGIKNSHLMKRETLIEKLNS